MINSRTSLSVDSLTLKNNIKKNKPRVFITGASGFVGSVLCKMLAERSWYVIAAKRSSSKNLNPVADQVVNLELGVQPEAWQKAMRSVDCVIHLAARVHQLADSQNDDAYIRENAEGSRFVAEQAALAGVKRFIFLSSIKVNGEGAGMRAYEADDPPEPQDAYGRSKLAAEEVVRKICKHHGMEFVCIRPPLVYGPGVRANFQRLISLAKSGLPLPLASIKNLRSLIFVENLCDFIALCVTHPKAVGYIWLVSDTDISTPGLIRKLGVAMNSRVLLLPCPLWLLYKIAILLGYKLEIMRLCESLRVNSNPAREILEWNPPVSLNDAIMRTV